ncbi:MAG: PAS domain-containing protein, partial [Actinomycetota bacterium]
MLLKTKKRATSGTVVSATAHVIAEQYGGTEHRVIASLNDSQAVIHFHPDGTIISANDNFLAALGYTHAEIVGQHHRIFVDPVEAASKAYLDFWSDLASGIFHTAEYRRIAKGGRDVWIQATYNPVYDEHGQVDRVVKFATDITRQRMSQQEIRDRTQAVIEFEPDGTIITANELFTGTVGYRLEELKGQHH